MKEEIALFLNPSSGAGSALKNRDKIENLLKKFGIKYELFISGSEKNLINLVRKNLKKYRTIVGIGGDTTFNIIVNQIIKGNTKSLFGMISFGSSNDIAREFGINSPETACLAIKTGKTEKIDIVEINCDSKKSYFIGTASLGLGVFVNKFIENMKEKGKFLSKCQPIAGVAGIRKSFAEKLVPLKIELSCNGKRYVKDFSLIVFNNTPYYATGLIPSPGANPSDGLLDCSIIKADTFFAFFKVGFTTLVLSTLRKKYLKRRNVEILKSKRFVISSEKGVEIQIDGEISGPYKRIELEVKSRALAIFTGNRDKL